jgi:hypothetical protein
LKIVALAELDLKDIDEVDTTLNTKMRQGVRLNLKTVPRPAEPPLWVIPILMPLKPRAEP